MSAYLNMFGDPCSFDTKVRPGDGGTFLFGNDTASAPFVSALILVLRVDPEGEPVSLFSKNDPNAPGEVRICTLQPGEVFAVPLERLVYVRATADFDSRVACKIVSTR